MHPVHVHPRASSHVHTARLPSSLRSQLVAQHAATHALLQELGERSSRDAERAASRLRELRLPAVLDEATAADGRLPPATHRCPHLPRVYFPEDDIMEE